MNLKPGRVQNIFKSLILCIAFGVYSCSTLPDPKFTKFDFPKEGVFVGDVERPYLKMDAVKSKVNYPTLDPGREEQALCKNYYNHAALQLLEKAKKRGADAVIKVKAITFLSNGKVETHDTAECFDDGEEGQILLEGIAVKWLPKTASPSPGLVKIENIPIQMASPSPSLSPLSGSLGEAKSGATIEPVDHRSHLEAGELAEPATVQTGKAPATHAPEPSVRPLPDLDGVQINLEEPPKDLNDLKDPLAPQVPAVPKVKSPPSPISRKHPGDPT